MDYDAYERELKADIRANGRPTSGFSRASASWS